MKFKRIRKNTKKNVTVWSGEEVEKLRMLFKIYGSDFCMISTFMNKSRDQIKRKFKSFEKKNKDISDQIFVVSSD